MLKRSLAPISLVLAALASYGCDSDSSAPIGSCAPSNAAFTAPQFLPASLSSGACTSANISAFIAACGVTARVATSLGATDTCTSWIAQNLTSACGVCLVNSNNNGAIIVDVTGLYPIYDWPESWIATNSFACTQLLTGSVECSSTGISLDDCENAACDPTCEFATVPEAFSECAIASTESGGACATTYATATANCQQFIGDAGYLDLPAPCYPEGGVNASLDAADINLAFIANLICGPSQVSDAGSLSDAALDAGSMSDATIDGGSTGDAGVDTGSPSDAAFDGASTNDAATDAGPTGDAATD